MLELLEEEEEEEEEEEDLNVAMAFSRRFCPT